MMPHFPHLLSYYITESHEMAFLVGINIIDYLEFHKVHFNTTTGVVMRYRPGQMESLQFPREHSPFSLGCQIQECSHRTVSSRVLITLSSSSIL